MIIDEKFAEIVWKHTKDILVWKIKENVPNL